VDERVLEVDGVEDIVLEETIVEEIVDMLLEDEDSDDKDSEEDEDVDGLVGVGEVELIPSVELEVVGGALVVVELGLALGWLPAAAALITLGSSLGRGTLPLTVHPPEADGQAGGLKVG
jgi:hypothetical protein